MRRPLPVAGGLLARVHTCCIGATLQGVLLVVLSLARRGSVIHLNRKPIRAAGPGAPVYPLWIRRLAIGLALVGVSCDSPLGVEGGRPAEVIVLNGPALSGEVGVALPADVEVRVLDAGGDPVGNTPVVWGVLLGGGSVTPASERTDSDGFARAIWVLGTTAGANRLSATAEGAPSATITADGLPGPLSSLTVTPDSVRFASVGDTARLAVQGLDRYRNAVVAEWSFTSSDTSVVRVDPAGLLTSSALGATRISVREASRGVLTDTIPVIVSQRISRVTIVGDAPELTWIGQTVPLSVSALDGGGNPIPASIVSWSSLDTTVVSVGQDGRIRAKKVGVSRIVASADDAADTVSVSVRQVVRSVRVTASATSGSVGEVLTVSAEAVDEGGTLVPGSPITWRSSNAGIATIDAAGRVRLLNSGLCTLTATSGDASGSVVIQAISKKAVDVPASGGSFTAMGGEVSVTVPPGALPVAVTMTVESVTTNQASGVLGSRAIDFGPDGLTFPVPLTVSLKYTADQLPTGTPASALRLYKQIGTLWHLVPGSAAHPEDGAVKAQLSSFSTYGIAPVVSSISILPASPSITLGRSVRLTATLHDAGGNVVADRIVAWSSESPQVAIVDPVTGNVTASTPGEARITATSEGASATVVVRVARGEPARVVVVDGGGQQAIVGSAVPRPLRVRVEDSRANPVVGATVSWTASGNGQIPSVSQTDADGFAAAEWKLGTSAGAQTATAAITGVEAISFSATALPGPAAQIQKTAGDGQVQRAGATLTNPLQVMVTDAFGNQLSGITVSWTTTSGTVPATTLTSSAGSATAEWTLGSALGAQSATATAGSAGSVSFTATAVTGSGSQLLLESGGGQVQTAGAALTTPLQVRVLDAQGNGVAGATVSWAASAGQVAASSLTDQTGRSSVTWTLGPVAGAQTVTASVSGAGTVTFNATAVAGAASQWIIVSGNGQGAAVGAAVADSLVARLADANGNGIAGAAVTWEIESGGGSLQAGGAVTNAAGLAKARWVLGVSAGEQKARVKSGSLTSASFTATATLSVATVALSASPDTLDLTQTHQFTVTLTGPQGQAIAGRSPAWSSSSIGVATVDSTGLVRAVAPGTSSITATIDGISASRSVIVYARVAGVNITVPATDSLEVGETSQLSAALTNRNGATLSGRTVAWLSLTTSRATVSSSGLVTMVDTGTVRVVASSEGVADTVSLRIHPRSLPRPSSLGGFVIYAQPYQDALRLILGPQLVSGSSNNPWNWFDSNAATTGQAVGDRFPAIPPSSDPNGTYSLESYYDHALVQYINYYRTGDERYLRYARKVADSRWALGAIAPTNGLFDDVHTPRDAALGGLILRAMDGRPEMWPALEEYTRGVFDIWVGSRLNNSELYLGVRDGGYMLLYAAWMAEAHPNAVIRAEFKALALSGARDYYARLQGVYPGSPSENDGSWRWTDNDTPGGPGGYFMQPLMVGILLEGMIATHQITGDATVRAAIIKSVDNLWAVGYRQSDTFDIQGDGSVDGRWRGMWYFVYGNACTPPTAPFCGEGTPVRGNDENVIRDVRQLNPLTIHAFGYAYKLTGNEQYKTWGDEIFSATFGNGQGPGADAFRSLADWASASNPGHGKEYNQSYRTAGRYLAWRSYTSSPW